MLHVELENGKYTIIHEEDGTTKALRYGKKWRNICGDNLILALAYRVAELESQLARNPELPQSCRDTSKRGYDILNVEGDTR